MPWLKQVHPEQEGDAYEYSQPSSGKPGIATTLAHALPPASGQPQRPGQPTSQGAGSQGARALQQAHSVTVYPKLLKEEKTGQWEPEKPNLIRAAEARTCTLNSGKNSGVQGGAE